MLDIKLIKRNEPKRDYKCCICHRKPTSEFQGYKGWICQNCYDTRFYDIIEHNKKLKEKRKYIELEPKHNFKNIEELMQETYVFWHNKLYHIEIIKNWSYNMLTYHLENFNKAVLNHKGK